MFRSSVAALAGVSLFALSVRKRGGPATRLADRRGDGVPGRRGGDAPRRVSVPTGAHQGILQGLPQAVDPDSIRVEGAADQALVIGAAELNRSPPMRSPTGGAEEIARASQRACNRQRPHRRRRNPEAHRRAILDRNARRRSKGREADRCRNRARDLDRSRGGGAIRHQRTAYRVAREGLRHRGRDQSAGSGDGPPASGRILRRASTSPWRSKRKRTRKRSSRSPIASGNARWAPVYDARLSTGGANAKPKIELVRRASIAQTSGEDWSEAELTLSTTRVAGGVAAPDMGSMVVNIFDPPSPMADAARQRSVTTAPAPQSAPAAGRVQQEAVAQPLEKRADEQQATIEATASPRNIACRGASPSRATAPRAQSVSPRERSSRTCRSRRRRRSIRRLSHRALRQCGGCAASAG